MIKFKYFNNDKLKKLGSAVLVTTMLGASALTLSGCDTKNKNNSQITTPITTSNTTTQENKKPYAVVVEDNIAIIYDEISRYTSHKEEVWYCAQINSDFKIELPADTYVLENCTLDDVKEYAKGLVSENGTVKTYDVEQEKTFVKVK